MLKILDAFELKEQGTVLYCKNDDFNDMSWNEIADYMAKIKRIKIFDKNLKEKEFGIKKHDVMTSISDKVSVALLLDQMIDNNNITIPSEITVLN